MEPKVITINHLATFAQLVTASVLVGSFTKRLHVTTFSTMESKSWTSTASGLQTRKLRFCERLTALTFGAGSGWMPKA